MLIALIVLVVAGASCDDAGRDESQHAGDHRVDAADDPTAVVTPVATTRPGRTDATMTGADPEMATPETIDERAMPEISAPGVEARVLRVIDGQRLDVSVGNRLYVARLIGIDAPDMTDPQRPAQCSVQVHVSGSRTG
jgi:hypothetical protein